MDLKHYAPTPWRRHVTLETGVEIVDANGNRVALLGFADSEHPTADARLQAKFDLLISAPEMYELLQELCNDWSTNHFWCLRMLGKLSALLAQIEGGE